MNSRPAKFIGREPQRFMARLIFASTRHLPPDQRNDIVDNAGKFIMDENQGHHPGGFWGMIDKLTQDELSP